VENAIKHGLDPQANGGHIALGARVESGNLVVSVVDDGRGLPEEVGDGVGLSNIRDRLRALFGDSARVDLQQNPPHGVQARIMVPYVRA
jgi:hypothetical protein